MGTTQHFDFCQNKKPVSYTMKITIALALFSLLVIFADASPRMQLARMARKAAHTGVQRASTIQIDQDVGDCDGRWCYNPDGMRCCDGHPDWYCCTLGLVCAATPDDCQ